MADASEALASLMAITDATEAVAAQLLAATGDDVQAAVELFFASAAADADADAAYARQLAGGSPGRGGGAGAGFGDEEDVRAPLPSFRETLAPSFATGPPVSPGALLPQRGDSGAAAAAAANASRQHLAAFRDFEAEAAAEGGGAGDALGGARRPRSGADAGLAGLFAPPTRLLYLGSFDQAKAAATTLDRWLLVNVQSNGAFGSHQLNRDTWGHDTVAELVQGSFVFLQTYDAVEEGRKLLTFYQLLHRELPVTLLVDPITGAAMHTWHGFVTPDRLLEDFVPFCDAPPSASAGPHKKHKPQQRAPQPAAPRSADEELAAAIAASLADADARAGGGMGGMAQDASAAPAPPVDAPAPPAAVPAPAVFDETAAAACAAALAAALPAEPALADVAGCRVGLRLPDGARTLRRFPLAEPVATLRSWAASAAPPAAAGRPFRLAAPGAALPADEQATSIEAAGLAGAMLAMTWAD